MSSTFLTRLRIGEILVDAKGVSRLYRPSPGRGADAARSLAAASSRSSWSSCAHAGLRDVADLLWLKLQVLLGLE